MYVIRNIHDKSRSPISPPFCKSITSPNLVQSIIGNDCAIRSVSELVSCQVCASIYYTDVIMSLMASQITSLTIVYSSVYPGTDQRKHQSSASLAFVMGIHRGPVNSPHKGQVTRKTFPFDDVIMKTLVWFGNSGTNDKKITIPSILAYVLHFAEGT